MTRRVGGQPGRKGCEMSTRGADRRESKVGDRRRTWDTFSQEWFERAWLACHFVDMDRNTALQEGIRAAIKTLHPPTPEAVPEPEVTPMAPVNLDLLVIGKLVSVGGPGSGEFRFDPPHASALEDNDIPF